ncbi:MAG: BatA domain-containing protein, partial [Planctomycetes bacterium]|nr:BatA domain-containing protein [Planctomycetota bacterium]
SEIRSFDGGAMNFLFPAMLAGIAGIAVPVLLHLIARHRFPVQDFPSIRLLQAEKRSNVFAFKLVDKAQLLLRALVLLLLALAMARPFLDSPQEKPPTFNRVVVLDCSSSMNMSAGDETGEASQRVTLMEVAKERAKELLSEVEEPGHSACVFAGPASNAKKNKRTLPADTTIRETGKKAALLPGHAGSVSVAVNATTIDGEGEGLVAALGRACGLLEGRHEIRSQIVVLSDMRRSAFAAKNQADIERIKRVKNDLGDRLDIVFVDVRTTAGSNFGLVEGYVRGGESQVGEDAHVVARIEHFSEKLVDTSAGGTKSDSEDESEKENEQKAHARLRVGKQKEPFVRKIALQPGSSAVVDMTTRVNKAVETYAQIYLQDPEGAPETDRMVADDRFSVPLEVADVLRVLIIDGTAVEVGGESETDDTEESGFSGGLAGDVPVAEKEETGDPAGSISGVRILEYVLNPTRKLGRGGGTGISPTVVTPEGLANQTLSKYQIICLYDVTSLAEQALTDLVTFAEQGGALLVICAEKCNPMKFNRTLAAAGAGSADTGPREMIAPARIGNEISLDSPVGVALQGGGTADIHPIVAPFRDQRRGDLSVVRFSKLRKIRGLANGAQVIMRSEPPEKKKPGIPLAVERKLERGRIIMLTFGFELDRGNVARTRVFPVLMWRTVDYLAKKLERKPPDVLTAMTPAVLDVSEPRFSFVDEVELVAVDMNKKEGDKDAEDRESGAVPSWKTSSTPLQKPVRLSIGEDRTVFVPGLPAGLYRLQKVQPEGEAPMFSAHSRYVAVNPDPRESTLSLVSDEELEEIAGPGWSQVKVGETVSFAPEGWEAWKWLVLALVVVYAGEGLIGWWLSVQREKKRSEELSPAAGEGTEA